MKLRVTLGLTPICSLVRLADARVVPTPPSRTPMNLSSGTMQLRNFFDSGRSLADLGVIDSRAEKFLARHSCARKGALIPDNDATSLSHGPEKAVDDFAHFRQAPGGVDRPRPTPPCGTLAWNRLGKAAPIRPARALCNFAQAHGAAISCGAVRRGSERAVTIEHLIRAGDIGGTSQSPLMQLNGMHLPSAAAFKPPERKWIGKQRGYTIVANVGAHWSDLAGGCSAGELKRPDPLCHSA